MKANFDELMKGMTDFLQNEAKTETIIGKEFKLGEFTCVPVMALGMGFGGGSGEGADPKRGKGEGGGAGAGMGMAPIGFLVTKGDQIHFISTRGHGGLSNAIEKLPDVFSKYFDSKKAASSN